MSARGVESRPYGTLPARVAVVENGSMAAQPASSLTPSSQEIERLVVQLVQAKVGRLVGVGDSVALLDLDSLALVELSAEIEKSIDVRLDEGILDADTVGDLVDYVVTLRRRKHGDPNRTTPLASTPRN